MAHLGSIAHGRCSGCSTCVVMCFWWDLPIFDILTQTLLIYCTSYHTCLQYYMYIYMCFLYYHRIPWWLYGSFISFCHPDEFSQLCLTSLHHPYHCPLDLPPGVTIPGKMKTLAAQRSIDSGNCGLILSSVHLGVLSLHLHWEPISFSTINWPAAPMSKKVRSCSCRSTFLKGPIVVFSFFQTNKDGFKQKVMNKWVSPPSTHMFFCCFVELPSFRFLPPWRPRWARPSSP